MVEKVVAAAFNGEARVYNWDFVGQKWINFSPSHKASNIKIVERGRQFFVKIEPGGTDERCEFDLPHDVQVTKTGDMIQFAVPDRGDKTGGKLIAIKFNEKHQEENFTMRASTKIKDFGFPIQAASPIGQARPPPESLSSNIPKPRINETFSPDRYNPREYQPPTLPGHPNYVPPTKPPVAKSRTNSATVANPIPPRSYVPEPRFSGEQVYRSENMSRKSPLNNLDNTGPPPQQIYSNAPPLPVHNLPPPDPPTHVNLPPPDPPTHVNLPPPDPPTHVNLPPPDPPTRVPPPQSMNSQDWTPVSKQPGYRDNKQPQPDYHDNRKPPEQSYNDLGRGHYDDKARYDNMGRHDDRGRYDDKNYDRQYPGDASYRNQGGHHDDRSYHHGNQQDRYDDKQLKDEYYRDKGHPREERRDYPREERRDYPREERRDYPREERRDYPREERQDYPCEERRDYPREERRDYPYDNQRDYSCRDDGYRDNWSSTNEWRRKDDNNYREEKPRYYDQEYYDSRSKGYPPTNDYTDSRRPGGREERWDHERRGPQYPPSPPRGLPKNKVDPLIKPPDTSYLSGENFEEEIHEQTRNLAESLSRGNLSDARDVLDLLMSLLPNDDVMTGSFTVAFQQGIKPVEKPITLVVQVEPLSGKPYPLYFDVKGSDTIESLKQQCHKRFKIPKECQYWVVGTKLAEDKHTMDYLKAVDNAMFYLYIQHPHKAKVHKNTMKEVGTVNYKRPTKEELAQAPPPGGYSLEPPPSKPHPPSNQAPPTLSNEPPAVFRDSGEVMQPKAPPPFGGIQVMPSAQRQEPVMINNQPNEVMERPPSPPPPAVPLPPPPPPPQEEEEKPGWVCMACTFKNLPYRPGCEVCQSPRPDDYHIPLDYVPTEGERKFIDNDKDLHDVHNLLAREKQEQQEQAQRNYQELINTDAVAIVTNEEEFECPVCYVDIDPGDGIRLRSCLHMVCKDCLKGSVIHSEEAEVLCPYNDEDGECQQPIAQREIREVLNEEELDQFFGRGLRQAEATDPKSFHCKTIDCPEFCFYEDEVNEFRCQNCGHTNCILCKAQHEGMNCQEYQDDLKIKAANDEAARQTQEMLENMVTQGEAMHCPQCKVIVTKKVGCDWIRCVMCKTEMCWATKGPRWGPKGRGDTSGGCRCGVNGTKCHPQCHNCH